MNREILVTLLRKDIRELDMLTEGFMDMTEYPKAIMQLALQKAENIQQSIMLLSTHQEKITVDVEKIVASQPVVEKTEENTAIQIPDVLPEENLTPDSDEDEEEPIIEINPEPLKVPEVTQPEPIPEIQPEEKNTSDSVLSRNELLTKNDNSIGAHLGNKRINDIKQAISIGERFLFQRELFKGNGEDMNKTLHYINQLATLEEALSFLKSKYQWDAENPTTETFLQIVKRRFV